jgi:chromosome segregation ATPase
MTAAAAVAGRRTAVSVVVVVSSPLTSTLDNNGGGGGEESEEDLRRSIACLRRAVTAHAEASAESEDQLHRLSSEHDSLLREHTALQEQMDDAVELLKYLKEEKTGYEGRMSELIAEVRDLREAAEENVVRMTITNLTREKMDLEEMLAEERRRGLATMAVAACAGMDEGGRGRSSSTMTKAEDDADCDRRRREAVVEELERRNAELEEEVEGVSRERVVYEGRIDDVEGRERREGEGEDVVRAEETGRRKAREEEYDRERDELLERVEELGRELRNTESSAREGEDARTREIEESERRLRAASAELEGERAAAGRARRELEACEGRLGIAERERDALLEERDNRGGIRA